MMSYYLWVDDLEKTKYYLEKFSNLQDIDLKYYDLLEREYSKLYLDIFNWEKNNKEKCLNYIK
jgi:hypothetical protein